MIDNDISVHMACYHLTSTKVWVKITYLI